MGERLTGRGTTWIRLLAIVPLLAAGIAVGAPSLASAATVCNTGEVYQVGGTFEGAVVVEANTQCRLNMATIRGGVTVEPGGYLFTDNAEIRGSVSGSGVNSVIIGGGVVRGDVTVAGSYSAGIHFAEVRGDVWLTGAMTPAALGFSTVRGSATLNDNYSATVTNNTIEADLACANNTNGVDNQGRSNTVGGTRSGQCANL